MFFRTYNSFKVNTGKIVVITAPSGSGKTTLVRRLLEVTNNLCFSISACTRQPRAGEVHGKDYYFLDEHKFTALIEQDAFVEWEMVYAGKYYGTLKTEMERIWNDEKIPLVDIDVKGALKVKNTYPNQCLTIFIEAPSMEELRRRLISRGTETPQSLEERVEKAALELTYASQFDHKIVNDNLEIAAAQLITIVQSFLSS